MASYAWILNLVILAVLLYVFPYVRKKAENQATKDDVGKITAKVESIKSEYALLLEDVRAHHLLRLAALEKRLAAHQAAYTLLREAYQQTGKSGFANML